MASFGIGAKLRQERVGRGFTIGEIARETKISSRYLEAIEAEDFDRLPGLIFTRNFVRQFAETLELDPDPLVAELPKLEEAALPLPDPPARSRHSFQIDPRLHSGIWLLLAVVGAIGVLYHFNRSERTRAASPVSSPPPPAHAVRKSPAAAAPPPVEASIAPRAVDNQTRLSASNGVQVIITAHQAAWVEVSADGRNTFTGTLQPDETKEVSAAEQVKLIAGNAGGLTVSLNGKTLEPLGATGQVRILRLTAEGPEFLAKGQQPAPDPL